MNDLATGAGHMDTSYLWRASKRGQRVHIQNPETGRTFCQEENCGGKAFDSRGPEILAGRRLCRNCSDLASRGEADYQEPDVRVLMGERLAETEPELFVGIAVPEQPKRRKRVNRSKAHRPKRGHVKHHMPFNDDLPW